MGRTLTSLCFQIKLLTERMSAMEDEHRKTRSYVNKLEVRTNEHKHYY